MKMGDQKELKDLSIKLQLRKAESIMGINYAIAYADKNNGKLEPEDMEGIHIDQVMTAPFGEDELVQCHHVHTGIDQRCPEDSVIALYIRNPMDEKEAWYATCEEHTSPPVVDILEILGEGERIDTTDM